MRPNGTKMAAVMVLMLAATSSLWGQESTWRRSCRFKVEVDGGSSSAGKIFESRGTPNLLGSLPGGAWFLLQPAERQALALPTSVVDGSDTDRQVVLRGALPTEGNPVSLTPSALTFDMAGFWVRVLPTPPLIGEVSASDFLEMCPDYQDQEMAYEPDSEMVQQIAAAGGGATVEVFFGSWCPHCQQILPRLMKSLRLANNAKIEVKWIGLPRSFSADPRAKARDVKGVPTIIVLSEGRELGRFSGTDKVPVETSLAKLVP